MKTVILYATKNGATAKCASYLREQVYGDVEIYDKTDIGKIDFSDFDKILIGSPVYAGQIDRDIKKFCEKNTDMLKEKIVGLFISSIEMSPKAIEYIKKGFPKVVYEYSIAQGIFGGELIFSKLNFLARGFLKSMTRAKEDIKCISDERIREFAKKINSFK